jgi:acetolactate synthase-1/3 small subunit
MEKKFVIAILVENQPSVLTRVSGMFTRRAFNIDSLTVGETEDPNYSRITIHATGDDSTRKQVMMQLRKLYNVKEVKVMEHTKSVYRELALIKLKNDPSTRQEVLSAVDIFRSKIVDFSPSTLCVEITGESSKIEAFIALVKPLGILEMCRTGVVALERGSEFLNSDTCVK